MVFKRFTYIWWFLSGDILLLVQIILLHQLNGLFFSFNFLQLKRDPQNTIHIVIFYTIFYLSMAIPPAHRLARGSFARMQRDVKYGDGVYWTGVLGAFV